MLRSNREFSRSSIKTLDLEQRVTVEAGIIDARAEAVNLDHLTRDKIIRSADKFVADPSWRRSMFDFLDPLEGKVVLDLGCGYASSPLVLALAGATVHACDVGPGALARIQRMAEILGVADRVIVHCTPAESLPFADEYFDRIFGSAVLHHLDLRLAGPEIARVLKVGGRGVFSDPLGHNLALEFGRDYLPYSGKHAAKGTDLPLRVGDIARFGSHFAAWEYEGRGMADLIVRVCGLRRRTRPRSVLVRLERALLRAVPPAQRYAPYAITRVRK